MQPVRIEPSWHALLQDEFTQPYFATLREKVRAAYLAEPTYPAPPAIFRAFELTPVADVSVVIIGQDPYHGPRQANGLSFAVAENMRIPPSLQNIFKEIKNDLGTEPLPSGDLTRWARQGVLLLNAVLTVRAGVPASHKGFGWEMFTDAAIRRLAEHAEHIVFMLWGKYAQEKGVTIDRARHLVLESAHPSPYSATRFFGNHHFSQCNKYLEAHGKKPIDWR